MTIANCFTFVRVLLAPVFLIVALFHNALEITPLLLPYVLLGLLIICEFSDLCDGYFARRFNQVSDFGKVFDPMADSIARTAIFMTFTLPPVELPIIYIFLFLYRDSVVSTIRTLCALNGFALAARKSGKIKAVIQCIAAFLVLLLMIAYSHGEIAISQLQTTSWTIISVALLYTLISGVEYVYANWYHINKLLWPQSIEANQKQDSLG